MANPELLAEMTAYVSAGAHSVGGANADFIESCLDTAIALVNAHVGTEILPEPVLTRAYIELGSELYNRKQAPNGISQFAAADGSAIRVARDPMTAVYPLLAPFLPGGFA